MSKPLDPAAIMAEHMGHNPGCDDGYPIAPDDCLPYRLAAALAAAQEREGDRRYMAGVDADSIVRVVDERDALIKKVRRVEAILDEADECDVEAIDPREVRAALASEPVNRDSIALHFCDHQNATDGCQFCATRFGENVANPPQGECSAIRPHAAHNSCSGKGRRAVLAGESGA